MVANGQFFISREDAIAPSSDTPLSIMEKLDEVRDLVLRSTDAPRLEAQRDSARRDAAELRKLLDEVTAQREDLLTRAAALVGEVAAQRDDVRKRVGDLEGEVEYYKRRVDELERVNTEQAAQLLDPDATCCADASRKSREMRLAHEHQLSKVQGVADLLAQALAGAAALNHRLLGERDALRVDLDKARALGDVYGRTMGRLLRRLGL